MATTLEPHHCTSAMVASMSHEHMPLRRIPIKEWSRLQYETGLSPDELQEIVGRCLPTSQDVAFGTFHFVHSPTSPSGSAPDVAFGTLPIQENLQMAIRTILTYRPDITKDKFLSAIGGGGATGKGRLFRALHMYDPPFKQYSGPRIDQVPDDRLRAWDLAFHPSSQNLRWALEALVNQPLQYGEYTLVNAIPIIKLMKPDVRLQEFAQYLDYQNTRDCLGLASAMRLFG